MGGPGELASAILGELAELPGMDTPGGRRVIMLELGLDAALPDIDWAGSAVVFCRHLLDYLSYGDGSAVEDLLAKLAGSEHLGVDRRHRFRQLLSAVTALSESARHGMFAADSDRLRRLPGEFRIATERGLAELGSKYLPSLYFRRPEIEARIEEFLESQATCFLVVSNPGRGKTNLLCDMANRLHEEWNVLFLTARAAVNGPYGMLELISSWLGYAADWQACFADLTRLARPSLILIDAINESSAPPDVLKEALHTLLREASRVHVKIVVTCRTDFWQFYRAPFWATYLWMSAQGGGTEWTRSAARGQDVPLFTPEQFDDVVTAYFRQFEVDGSLRGEAAEQCRHPLMLRIFCEAYAGRSVGTVTELRLYRLFKEFWTRKIGQVTEIANLRQPDAVARLVLTVAGLMFSRQSTAIAREAVASALAISQEDLGGSSSLYSRVLDEEIILEENVDEEAGIRNVVFVYDRFAEYAIALSLYSTGGWQSKAADQIVAETRALMGEESRFGTLRGALEFLVLRLEDRRSADRIHFAILAAMLKGGWKWASIGTALAFQLDPSLSGPAFWDFTWQLAKAEIAFIRRMAADHIGVHANRDPDRVLAVLNRLREDPTTSVRDAATRALQNLPLPLAIREIELLAGKAEDQPVAAQLLLWPWDGTSLALHRKLEWLAGPGRDVMPEGPVMALLQAETDDSLGDLFGQEELTRALQDVAGSLRHDHPHSAEAATAGAWQNRVEQLCQISRQSLENDLTVLERTFALTDLAVRRAASFGARGAEPLTPLDQLIPDSGARSQFIGIVLDEAGVTDAEFARRHWLGNSCLSIAAAIASASVPDSYAGIRIVRKMISSQGFQGLSELRGIANTVFERAARTGALPGAGLRTELPLAPLSPLRGTMLRFQQEVFDEYGLTASPADLRGLTTMGRMVLWIHRRLQQQRLHESHLLRLREEVKALDPGRLRDRIAAFQRPLPDERQREELRDELLVLTRLYGDRPAQLAELLAPLVTWHHGQDSDVLAGVADQVHQQNANEFWRLTQALLTHSDDRVVDFASAAMERAEHVEHTEPPDPGILTGLAEIIEEIAGVPADEVRIDSSFVDDLDLDSLSMVELAVVAQDKFGVEIPDEQLSSLRTVRDAVEYVQRTDPGRSRSGRWDTRT